MVTNPTDRTASLLQSVLIAILLMSGLTISASAEDTSTVLADLPDELLARLAIEGQPDIQTLSVVEQLERVFAAESPYRFEEGPFVLYADHRWFSTISSRQPGAPVIELRRWPGDTVMALYAVAGPLSHVREALPAFVDGEFTLQSGASDTFAEWRGTVESESGLHPAVWIEQLIGDTSTVLGALLLPGDAGLGPGAVASLQSELFAVLRRVETIDGFLKGFGGTAHTINLILPRLNAAPVVRDEMRSPWQVIVGSSFTIGLPPGVRARRLDGNIPPPVPVPEGLLWFRGRYTDKDGLKVILGDSHRVGYISVILPEGKNWRSGEAPPLGVPEAVREDSIAFDALADAVGASSARVQKWREPGFDGIWMLFRIYLKTQGLEIAIPVIEGRKSPSLYWIPMTWRGANLPPAPAPIDPAERFGIRMEKFSRSDLLQNPWSEGYFSVPGLRALLPKGWWPAASLQSEYGFPVRLVTFKGKTLARLTRLDADELPDFEADDSEWSKIPRPGMYHAIQVHGNQNGDRIYVSSGGAGFLLTKVSEDVVEDVWEQLVGSVELRRTERKRPARTKN
jgi:hypothetical protein